MSVLIKAISISELLDYTTFTRTALLVYRMQLLANYVGKRKKGVSRHSTLFLPSKIYEWEQKTILNKINIDIILS